MLSQTTLLRRAALVASVALLAACTRPEPAEAPIRSVRVMDVPKGTATLQHEYPGEIRARVESRLGFRVGGKLTSRLVNVGDAVRSGQVLARLDPQDLRLGQDAARAALAAARSTLDIQEAEVRRYKELREQGFISSLELERREASLKSARAQAEQAQAQAMVQGHQAGYADLFADAPGVVVGVDAEPGAVVAAGAPILRVAQDGPRDAIFSVPEGRLPRMRSAQARKEPIEVRLTGAGDQSVKAQVREIAAAADPVTRTFLIKADIGQASIRLGQTATVIVDEPPIDQAVRLPLTAVFELKGQSAVWLLDRKSMTVAPKPIVVAGADGNLVIVASGISAGQTVVTAGVHALSPGQNVKLYVEPTPAKIGTPTTMTTSVHR